MANVGPRLGSFSVLATIDIPLTQPPCEPGAADQEPRPTNAPGPNRKLARLRSIIVTKYWLICDRSRFLPLFPLVVLFSWSNFRPKFYSDSEENIDLF